MMERSTSLLSFSSRSSSSSSTDRKKESLLPYSESVSEKTVSKLRNPLGHCLYRRVLIWTAISLIVVGFVLFGKREISVPDVASTLGHRPSSPFHWKDEGLNSQSDKSQKSEVISVGSDESQTKDQDADGSDAGKEKLDDEADDDDDDVPEYKQDAEEDEYDILLDAENADEMRKVLASLRQMPWLRFPQ